MPQSQSQNDDSLMVGVSSMQWSRVLPGVLHDV